MTNTAASPRHNLDAVIGENVHRLMWRARKSQTETAMALGMTQGALSRKLRGDRPWYADEIQSAATLFKREVGDLFKLLPDLDSNQEPAGSQSAASNRPLAPVTTLKPRAHSTISSGTAGVVTPLHATN